MVHVLPPTSRIEMVRDGDHVTITLPPPGLSFGNAEVKFALAFTAIVAGLSGFFWLLLQGASTGTWVMFGSVVALFWLVCVGLMIEAWRRSRQIAIMDVVDGHLVVTTSMPLGTRAFTIESRFIKALGVGPSGVVVNDEPVMALRIDSTKAVEVRPGTRKKVFKLFRERDVQELEWVAETLRDALGVESSSMRRWEKDAASSRAPGGMSDTGPS
ncbi:MAG: hypothetical protein AAGI30_08250 [Planctomycetota bacterium]